MSAADFFDETARKRAAECVAAVERETGAEMVIVVRRISGRFRAADYLGGFAIALLVLAVLIFHPHAFDEQYFPFEVLLGFVLGASVTANVVPLRRALAGAAACAESVRTAARAAFFDGGISRTKGRSGLLVYVSMFEKRVELVPDIGLDLGVLGPRWTELESRLASAVRAADFGAFLETLKSAAPLLAEACPRCADDVNELPDEMRLG